MNKNIGEIGEMEFILQAKKKGFSILLPYGENIPYDLAVTKNNKIHRIQVKTCNSLSSENNNYRVSTSNGSSSKKKYLSGEIDFFAIYLMKLNIFYIIPIDEVKVKTIRFYIDREHKFTKYAEKWDLLE